MADQTIARAVREACGYRGQVHELQELVRQQGRSLELSAMLATQERQQLQQDKRQLIPHIQELQQRTQQLQQHTEQLQQHVQQLQQHIQQLQQHIHDQDEAQDHMVSRIMMLERLLQDVRYTSYLGAIVFTSCKEQRRQGITTIVQLIRSARVVVYLCMHEFTSTEVRPALGIHACE